MKSELVANIIWLIHVLVVILMVLVPLFGNKKYVSMYILIVPFLFFHWATNDDTCFLTILERKLRNVEKKDAFLQKLISPIYLLPNDDVGKLSKLIVLFLYYYCLYTIGAIKKML